MDLSEFKESTDYKSFYNKYDKYGITGIKNNINEINSSCLNKDFIYLLIFDKWIHSETVSRYKEQQGVPPNYKYDEAFKDSTFNETNFYPYSSGGYDYIYIIDVGDVIDILNAAGNVKNPVESQKIDDIYQYVRKGLKTNATVSKVTRIDTYVNANFKNHEKSNSGLYYQILVSFQYENIKEFLVDHAKQQGTNYERNIEKFVGRELIKELRNELYSIQDTDFNTFKNKIDIYNHRKRIEKAASKIVNFFTYTFNMIIDTYNVLQVGENKEDNYINKIEIAKQNYTLSIDEIIALSKGSKAAFKKAYVARENNLSAYIKIKMLYYVKGSNDYIEINNFNIPYNNIISLDHDVKSMLITLNIIDTEGNLSELLIYKMYNITTQISQSKKINNVQLQDGLPYVFEVEYGWSGPKTDDEEELLEENVFVKKTFRGYIKSIASRFSNNGNEYTLQIFPIDYEDFSHANFYNIFYKNISFQDTDHLNACVGLIMIYLISKYSIGDEIVSKIYLSPFNFINVIEMLFLTIEDQNQNRFISIGRETDGYHIYLSDANRKDPRDIKLTNAIKPISETKTVNGKQVTEINNDDVQLIESLITDVNPTKYTYTVGRNTVTIENYRASDIKIENLNNSLSTLLTDYSLNAWLVGSYIIWKIHKYFKADNQFFIFHDTTGLFDYFYNFQPIPENGKFNIMNKNDTYIFNMLNKFNIFCFEREDQNFTSIPNNFYSLLKESIRDDKYNKYNKYEIVKLVDPQASSTLKDEKRRLNFFTNKLQDIFKQIKNIGLGVGSYKPIFDENNIYQLSTGVDVDFMTHKNLTKDYLEKLKIDYEKKMKFNKKNIYSSIKPNKPDEDKRDVDSYKIFEKNLNESAADVLTKKLFSNYKFTNQKINDTQTDKEYFYSNIFKGAYSEIEKLDLGEKISRIRKNNINLNILYLSYGLDQQKMIQNKNIDLGQKISFLTKNILQSYSFGPRIIPKTRNSNKQFFGQGNNKISDEGTGDIIEFNIDEFSVATLTSLDNSNQNSKNIGFNDLANSSFKESIMENAAKYYRTFININGQIDVNQIVKDMTDVELNYQNQINISGSITILGEPYWSNISVLNVAHFVLLNIYYSNGTKSPHSGLYSVTNATQNINMNKFTTKLDLKRIPTFQNTFSDDIIKTSNTFLVAST